MTWEIRAVDKTGTLVSVVDGVTVEKISREINARESCELTIDPLETDATLLDLFSHEVQVWEDATLRGWFRPARAAADVSSSSAQLRVTCEGLFSYFFDEVIGGQRNSHIISPHEDISLIGAEPTYWTKTSGVEAAATVDNNAEFWQTPVAIQVNNSEAGQDAYIYQRYTVPAEFDNVPFAAMATVYISDNQGGSPVWGGAAYNDRGLMIHRLNSSGQPLSDPMVAKITDETTRNQVVRLQTDEVLPRAGDIIEVRLYSPAAWVVWRFAGLYDGRAVKANLVDKSQAFITLVAHAQDTALGKQDRSILTDVVDLGETISAEWPWWRRDVIGEQIDAMADTFEFEMVVTATTRTLRVRAEIGTDRSATVSLAKEDFTAWGLGTELGTSASRVIRQGEGSGIARDEWWTDDTTALNGNIVEALSFAPPGESLQRLRDAASEELDRLKKIEKLPTATIVGDLATTLQEGDTVAVNLTHGWAQFVGNARVMKIDFVPAARAATLHLEAV